MVVLAAGLWLGSVVICIMRMRRAQLRYINSYAEVHQVPLPYTRRWTKSPDWPVSNPMMAKRLWDIVWEEQGDARLERERQEVVRRWWFCVAIGCGGVVLPILASYL